MKKKKIYFGIFFSILIGIILLKTLGKKENIDLEFFKLKEIEMKKSIQNREIVSLKKILGDSVYKSKSDIILFLFSGHDCGKCIGLGFNSINKLQKENYSTFIVSIDAPNGLLQMKYNYKDYIFDDVNDLIRKELKYIFTPVILYIDSYRRINDVFFIYPWIDEDILLKTIKSELKNPSCL